MSARTNRATRPMAKSVISTLFVLFFLPKTYAFTGKVATWTNSTHRIEQVQIRTLGKDILENDLVSIDDLLPEVRADKEDCFCFDENSPAFAQVNAFYYATKQIEFFNN